MTSKRVKRQKRILLVVRWPVGGIRTYMRYIYRYFDPAKYAFTLIAPGVSELKLLRNDLSHLNIRFIAIEERPSNWQYTKEILKETVKRRYDLIHSHGFTSGICSIPGSLLRRIPHLLTSHDVFTEKQFSGLKGRLKKLSLSIALAVPDIIQSVSNDAQENLLNYLPILRLFRHRLVIIRNGILADQYIRAKPRNLRRELKLKDDMFIIGYMGRFMSQKGFSYLVDAMDSLKSDCNLTKKPIVLAFGEGGFQRQEKENVNKKRLNDYFIFLPFVSDIAPSLKSLDVLVMPSIWEACGLLAMEAMTAGVPVIGTSCTGLREVLKGTPSKIVPPKNSKALAEAVIEEMRNSRKKRANDFIDEASKRFEVKKQSFLLNNLIERCIRDEKYPK